MTTDPHRHDCTDCDRTARGALPRLMDDPRCRQCREATRDE